MDQQTRDAVEQQAQLQARRGTGRKRHIVDSRIELNRRGATQSQQRVDEDIAKTLQEVSLVDMCLRVALTITQEAYLQPSRLYQERLDILQDPLSHFINVNASRGKQFLRVAPPNILNEALNSLYDVPVGCLRRQREDDEEGPSKRAREDSEVGRHESLQPQALDDDGWNLSGLDVGAGDNSAWNDGQNEDTFQLDEGQGLFDQDDINQPPLNNDLDSVRGESVSGRSQSTAPSRMTTPSLDTPSASQYEAKEGEAPIAMFGRKQTKQDTRHLTKDGYSRNTMKAKEFLKARLPDTQPDHFVSFSEVSDKANKRAASAFFFEMLVLGSRQQVNLKQESAFGDIQVSAKDKLLA